MLCRASLSLVPALLLAACAAQPAATPTPTEKPMVTHTAALAATPTETPFFGGGPELPGGLPDQMKALLDAGMKLPITDCVTAPESDGDQESWNGWIGTLAEQGANELAIADLQATINAKLKAWGISDATSLELCAGGDGGWSFAVRDNSSKLLWWSFDLQENRFADRPDRVFENHDWQFKPMPREGLKSGLAVEVMMINGWPLAVAVNPDAKPIQYFDPVLGEFINFYPDTPTPTRTASPTPTITNTPRPTAIPATAVPKPSPTFTPEPSETATATPEIQQVPPIRAGEIPSLGQINKWCKGYFQLPKFPTASVIGMVDATDTINKTMTVNGTVFDASPITEVVVWEILDRDRFAQSYYGDDVFRVIHPLYSIDTVLPYIVGSHTILFAKNSEVNNGLAVFCDAVSP